MYLSAMRYPVFFFYPLHLYVFVLICQYYVVLLERTNKDIIYIYITLIRLHKKMYIQHGVNVCALYFVCLIPLIIILFLI